MGVFWRIFSTCIASIVSLLVLGFPQFPAKESPVDHGEGSYSPHRYPRSSYRRIGGTRQHERTRCIIGARWQTASDGRVDGDEAARYFGQRVFRQEPASVGIR